MTKGTTDLAVTLTAEELQQQADAAIEAASLLAEQQQAAAADAASLVAAANTPVVAAPAPVKALDFAKISQGRTVAKRDFMEKGRKITEFTSVGNVVANGVDIAKYAFRVEGINNKFTVLAGSGLQGFTGANHMRGAIVDFAGVYSIAGENTYANVRSLTVVKLSNIGQLAAAGVAMFQTVPDGFFD